MLFKICMIIFTIVSLLTAVYDSMRELDEELKEYERMDSR